ncbi:MAG: AraC family transcriptional regulator N-terminal domain-containing protein [Candidatus Sericytochromatia bacterium]
MHFSNPHLRAQLAEAIAAHAPQEGLNPLPLPGMHCIKFGRSTAPRQHSWRATLGIAAQGCKEIYLAQTPHRLADAHYIASPIDLPVTSRIVATAERPFLCLRLDFDPLLLSEIAAQLDPVPLPSAPQHALYVGAASEALLDSALRLLKQLHDPQSARVLGPLIQRELYYHLLQSPNGAAIRQFVRAGNALQAVYAAIHQLRSQLHADLDVGELAASVQMSRSAFHKRFREATAMSPIQYQKQLRLLEARRLLCELGETAERAAYAVGYRSPSQFNREYTRCFGQPPRRDVRQLQADHTRLLALASDI